MSAGAIAATEVAWELLTSYSSVLLAAELLFCVPNLPRRPHFAARFGAVLVVCGIGLNSYLWTSTVVGGWGVTPFAAVVFIASVAALRALFDAGWDVAFFFGAAAYSVEGITYFIRRADAYFGWFAAMGLWGNVVKLALVALTLLTVYRVLVLRYQGGGLPSVSNGFLLAFVAVTLLVVNLMSTWVRVSGAQGALTATYGIICNVLLLTVQFDVFRRSSLERECDLALRLDRERLRQQRASRENIELINVKCHDLKHQIAALRTMPSSEERDRAVSELEDAVMLYDSEVHTGNEAVDTLLTEKSLVCRGAGIELSCMVDGEALSGMGIVDVYALLGNALDNAIEAARLVEDPDARVVSLRVERRSQLACVLVENSCVGRVGLGEDGLPRTSKEDVDYHGFGLRSIRMIVEKYGGNMVIDADEGRFSLSLLLLLPVEGSGR